MSIMYKYTRQEAAEMMNVSTRSVDRYIKAGKLRAKKNGKVVYVKGSDVEALMGTGIKNKQEVIVESKRKTVVEDKVTTVSTGDEVSTLKEIYIDLKSEIIKKDELIQTLAMRVGQAEEIAKNSVSLVEFKKSQFLLEESKVFLSKELEDLQKEKEELKLDLKYEKNSNLILIIVVIVLIIITGIIWFIKI